jgi:four helix bundle protein
MAEKMTEERWEKLEVWRQADEMAYHVYLKTRGFPKEEIYGITSQLRRAALSIPTNIVEGYSRKGDRELARFLNVSLGSLAEVKYLIYFSHRLNYLSDEDYAALKSGYDKLGKNLWRFYETVSGGKES